MKTTKLSRKNENENETKVSFKPQEGKTIILRQKREESYVLIKNINFITCEVEVSTIHFVENYTPITVSRTLTSLLEEIKEYGFIKSHHNTIVNLLYIHKIQNGDCKQLLMKNGETVKISARKLPKIRKILILKNNTY
jgi:two-component system LytT family response regulator